MEKVVEQFQSNQPVRLPASIAVRKIINSIPFRQRLWESFPTKAVGTLSNSLSCNIPVVWASAEYSAFVFHYEKCSVIQFDRKAYIVF